MKTPMQSHLNVNGINVSEISGNSNLNSCGSDLICDDSVYNVIDVLLLMLHTLLLTTAFLSKHSSWYLHEKDVLHLPQLSLWRGRKGEQPRTWVAVVVVGVRMKSLPDEKQHTALEDMLNGPWWWSGHVSTHSQDTKKAGQTEHRNRMTHFGNT